MMRAFCLLLLLLTGCMEQPQTVGEARYFDVAGFVDQQVTRLTDQPPLVRKQTALNGRRQERTTRRIDWARELNPFREADLNRPAWRDRYRIDTTTTGAGRRITYVARDGDLPLDFLEIELAGDQLRALRADLRSENVLYDSRRRLELTCNPATGQLEHYGVRGFQKLVLRDSVRFHIDARLSRP